MAGKNPLGTGAGDTTLRLYYRLRRYTCGSSHVQLWLSMHPSPRVRFVRLAALQPKAMPAVSGGPLPHRLSLRKAFTCFAKLSVTSL